MTPWHHINNRIPLDNGQINDHIKPGADYLCRWLPSGDGEKDRKLAIDTPNFEGKWKSEGFWRRKNPPIYDWVLPIPSGDSSAWKSSVNIPEKSDIYGTPTALINLQSWCGRQKTIDPRPLYLGRYDYVTCEWVITLIHFASIGEFLVNYATIEASVVRWCSLPRIEGMRNA